MLILRTHLLSIHGPDVVHLLEPGPVRGGEPLDAGHLGGEGEVSPALTNHKPSFYLPTNEGPCVPGWWSPTSGWGCPSPSRSWSIFLSSLFLWLKLEMVRQIFNKFSMNEEKEMHYNYSYISREMKYRRKEESMYLNKIIPTWTQEKSLFTLTRWIYFQISDPSVRACSLIQRYPSTSADCCLQTSPLHTNTWKVSCSLSIANSYNTGFKHLIRCIEGTQ